MAVTTQTSMETLHSRSTDRLLLSGSHGPIADWHRDLIRDGFAVVKGAVPAANASKYADDMFEWLENLYDLSL